MIKPIGLINGHAEVRGFTESLPIFEDLLGFEIAGERPGELTLRHPRTPGWPLIMHEMGDSNDKPVRNHYGVRVATNKEVDDAFEYIKTIKERYNLGNITKPIFLHLSWCFYTEEPGGNFWEIECYEKAIEEGRGGIARGHWDPADTLGPEHADAKGYVVQAYTHGTLECDDRATSVAFYEKVLGLDAGFSPPAPFRNAHPIYIKHRDTPWYIVVLPTKKRKILDRNQRFTLGMASDAEVEEAHRWFSEEESQLGITKLEPIQTLNQGASFLFSDPDLNWWEITSASE